MCSSCVTAGLNIVGEKPFSCAKCLKPVERFTFTKSSNGGHAALHTVHESVCSDSQHQSLSNLAVDPPNAMSAPAGLSALEVDENGLSVLRLDDVPWNVTPAMLSDWSGVPIAHAHVLLNDEGKTLNHAYIEVPPQSAHEVLLKCRNKVLGSGKRARKVTITFSSQSELMRYLFPSWMGDFSGNQPTVANVDSKCLPAAIFNGILTAKDLQTFHRLVFHPNPRCVKDPSLPFFVLVSVINKFPTDDNSRIFWNFSTRDVLFNLAFISITRLSKRSYYWSNRVITALAGALLTCPIFTTQQVNQVRELFEPTHSSSESSFISTPAYSEHREPSPMIYHPANGQYHWSPYDTIARDLGLEPHVVQAVCQRLTQTYI
ncbi:uncharacterized protein EI90DRAFT_3070128 [Cantharellus anzutake]|uniref:uncharacterized protein n=1 Tax=Cantharellus anzutake TaxID=1750568 RepID=UPI0019050F7D|nr:uncharacterized protein EI90DRAFT_3070128 [Cantharellus anzutake]KAF8326674.1 hypothetical protein EI90DRAFT_3070128 [Cantharellus anzutake]